MKNYGFVEGDEKRLKEISARKNRLYAYWYIKSYTATCCSFDNNKAI